MLRTLKDLCSTFPKIAVLQSPLDNVAATMFNPDISQRYVHSVSVPDERYGIPIDQAYLRHHNDIIPDFSKYGPNEQYLINKLFFSPRNLLYLIGEIGVGKTRFAHFLITEVLPQAFSQDSKAQKYGPCPIYYDFRAEGHALPSFDDSAENSDSIRAAFLGSFCDRIEAELYSHSFFDLEHEVGTIWDSLFDEYKDDHRKNNALSFIISQMNVAEAEHRHLVDDYPGTIKKRKAIRREIREDQAHWFSYLALLLRYTRQHYFDSSPAGLLLVIDNVDREPSLVQQGVKLIVKPFARLSGGRTILIARQTTYYQQFDDGSSDPVDIVPYCGPEPLDILKARIDDFINDHARYGEFYDPQHLPQLVAGIRLIRDIHISSEAFDSLFSSLCGHSVRNGLLLAQNVINNSVYDPSSITGMPPAGHRAGLTAHIGDVLRALLVGTDDIFQTNPNNRIDNIFDVEQYSGKCYLLKLRILRLLRCAGDKGTTIIRLIDMISSFGYTLSMICDAINELKSTNKGLLWSDAVSNNFLGQGDLVRHGPTKLYITTTGEGYVDKLAGDIDYVQEVMLDTKVDSATFSSGWKYDRLEDRFELVLRFLTELANVDQEEVRHFVSTAGADEYGSAFCGSVLLTRNMFASVKGRVERILSSAIETQRPGDRRRTLEHFKAGQMAAYEDRMITLDNFEHGMLR